MRKLYTILAAVLITASVWAQSPQKMSYQAVIRNTGNQLITSHAVGMKISILQDSVSGKAVYVEKQLTSTNANGLVAIEIGGGTIVYGTFTAINWAKGPYFIKTQTDPTGDTIYTITGTNELLSVPYALFSGPIYTIGESYGGGIVFYVYDGGKHGLIAATADQSTGIQWDKDTTRYTGTSGDGLGAGAMNTAMIVATQMADNQNRNFAAKVCADYSVTVDDVTYGDWYLPSKYELNLLYLQKNVVGGFADDSYWSSTEYESHDAWKQHFLYGFIQSADGKHNTYYVRAIRAF